MTTFAGNFQRDFRPLFSRVSGYFGCSGITGGFLYLNLKKTETNPESLYKNAGIAAVSAAGSRLPR